MITIEEIEENVEEWIENKDGVLSTNNIKSKFKQAIYDRSDDTSIENISTIKPKLVKKIVSMFNENLPEKHKDVLSRYTKMTIQKYEKGEYLKPHTDIYEVHFLMILTDSEMDGITIEDQRNRCLVFHQDEIGKVLKIQRNSLHWVNPVRGGVRYSVAIVEEIGKHFTDSSPQSDSKAPCFDLEGNLIDLEGNLIDSEGNLI